MSDSVSWVPVGESLPDSDGLYPVVIRSGHKLYCDIWELWHGEWSNPEVADDNSDVLYWLPIPPIPPEERMSENELSFDEWKRRARLHLRKIERAAKVRARSFDVLLGDDVTMRIDGHESIEFFDDPEGYVDYQLECAQ